MNKGKVGEKKTELEEDGDLDHIHINSGVGSFETDECKSLTGLISEVISEFKVLHDLSLLIASV